MATVEFYLDESGSPRIFVLAGYYATEERWIDFEAKWQEILRDAGHERGNGEILPFHMTDFEHRQAPFDGWDNQKRIEVISGLLDCINETVDGALIVALPLSLYRTKLPMNSHLKVDHPLHRCNQYMACLYRLYLGVVTLLESNAHIERISFIFDRNKIVSGMVQSVLQHLADTFPELGARIAPPRFEDKTQCIPLQAADILAYESMKHRDNKVLESDRPIRKSYDRLKKSRYLAFDYSEKSMEEISWFFWKWAVESGLLPDDPVIRAYLEASGA
jgi:hypothetical protein